MNLKIYTEGKVVLEESWAISITLPTESGVITILEDHVALITKLAPGGIYIESDNISQEFFIEGGLLKIKDNQIDLIVDLLQDGNDIVLEEIQRAIKQAEKALENPDLVTDSEISRLQAVIQRESAREDFLAGQKRASTTAPENE